MEDILGEQIRKKKEEKINKYSGVEKRYIEKRTNEAWSSSIKGNLIW